MRTASTVTWRTYQLTRFIDEPILFLAHEMSCKCALLYIPHLKQATWYLGDLCYAQVQGDHTTVPDQPPKPMYVTEVDFMLLRDEGWPQASMFVTSVSPGDRTLYYRKVTAGPLLPPLVRGINTDVIGPASISDERVRLPHPPPSPTMCDFVASQTHATESVDDYFPDWTVQVAGPAGETLTIPIMSRTDTHACHILIPENRLNGIACTTHILISPSRCALCSFRRRGQGNKRLQIANCALANCIRRCRDYVQKQKMDIPLLIILFPHYRRVGMTQSLRRTHLMRSMFHSPTIWGGPAAHASTSDATMYWGPAGTQVSADPFVDAIARENVWGIRQSAEDEDEDEDENEDEDEDGDESGR